MSDPGSGDDELQRAIALSLQEATNAFTDVPAEADSDTDFDRDLHLAMALSLSQQDPSSAEGSKSDAGSSKYAAAAPQQESKAQSEVEAEMATKPKATAMGLAGLDRRAMERERLERMERLGKRKRSVEPEVPSKLVAREAKTEMAAATGRGKSTIRSGIPTAAPSSNAISTSKAGMQFPNGAVKRTWAYKFPRTDDITLEEVLQAQTLNIAVLSSFQWDNEFLFHKADPRKIKQIWIISAKQDDLRAQILQDLKDCKIPNLKPHFPPMGGQIANMHSKLMLLFHETHLRIVIPTANMMKVEWGETGQIPEKVGSWQPAVFENSLFLIDLPRLPEEGDVKMATKTETWFHEQLITFLKAQEVGEKVIEGLGKFDFSQTDRFAFVHSIGGSHTADKERNRTGLPGLSKSIRKLNLHDVERIELDYAASSLGSLKEDFLRQIYNAASGEHPLHGHPPSDFLDHFRIYFPTHDTVINSTGGIACGGIITLNRAFYNNAAFPKKCLRNYKSTRAGVLSHNKLLLARGYKTDGTPFAWAYIGSANVSEAAWGSHRVLKSGKEGTLSIRNWECGVVVPVPTEKLGKRGEVPGMGVFEGTVEVPFEFPGEEYAGNSPWFSHD